MKIGVVGLGYVGLPVALAFSRKFEGTVGFDINSKRIINLKAGIDETGETSKEELEESPLTYADSVEAIRDCNFIVVTVPTPVDRNNNPDLSPLHSASKSVGSILKKGDIVVFESTVYPGVTEDVCGPILEEVSGLTSGKDFFLGYSPERINPGDKKNRLETIVKVVSGQNEETLRKVSEVYGAIIQAGVHEAPSIKVAEAAKVIENTQRDLNIALMNELAIIFDRINISTKDVLAAAGTKWNFLNFYPGLVGGHCIGVDPYYLTTLAEQLGYHPQVVLAGRRINDGMGKYIAQQTIKRMVNGGAQIRDSRIGVLGITFKENVPDIRNSRVPDIHAELREFGCSVISHDPIACPEEVHAEYGITLSNHSQLKDLDAVILAVSHDHYLTDASSYRLSSMLKPGGVVIDVKSALSPSDLPEGSTYWAL